MNYSRFCQYFQDTLANCCENIYSYFGRRELSQPLSAFSFLRQLCFLIFAFLLNQLKRYIDANFDFEYNLHMLVNL